MRVLAALALAISFSSCSPTVMMELSRPKGLGSDIPFVSATVGDATIYVGDTEQKAFRFSPVDAQMRVFVKPGNVALSSVTVDVEVADRQGAACKAPLGAGIPLTLPWAPFTVTQPAPSSGELMVRVDIGAIARQQCPRNLPAFTGNLKAIITVRESNGVVRRKHPVTLIAVANCADIPVDPDDPDQNPCPS
ncbi:MAG TPA: hypothetical protein VE010_07770 [Thermoanaerobaculia bacterium]|nr:hypothetical protein [Thermoanaerobaculia bacterium]